MSRVPSTVSSRMGLESNVVYVIFPELPTNSMRSMGVALDSVKHHIALPRTPDEKRK